MPSASEPHPKPSATTPRLGVATAGTGIVPVGGGELVGVAGHTDGPRSPKGDLPGANTSTGAPDSDSIKIEIDGPGVSPATVDAPLALEIAAALLGFVQRAASDRDMSITIRGLSIEDKCAAVVAHVDQSAAVREIAREALSYVRGDLSAPRGTGEYVSRLRGALKRLPDGQTAAVMMGTWREEIVASGVVVPPTPWSRLAHRARLLRVGGQRPMARFESKYDGEFSLLVDVDAARQLGMHLYRSLDIEARVARDAEGDIVRGELIEWHLVGDGDPSTALRGWFKDHAITATEYDQRRRDDD